MRSLTVEFCKKTQLPDEMKQGVYINDGFCFYGPFKSKKAARDEINKQIREEIGGD